ncbi:MAG: hypothetical protein HY078_06610 [Elusimicrobia bacterium]|nr:hypothetical protein [Elusimicrobiota bacterium]
MRRPLAVLFAVAALAGPLRAAEAPELELAEALRSSGYHPSIVEGVKHQGIKVRILPASTPVLEAGAGLYHEPYAPSDPCALRIFHPSLSAQDYVYQGSTIPRKYLARQPTNLHFIRVLLHEAKHCDQYGTPELDGEIESDLFATDTLRSARLPGYYEDTRMLTHIRAVRPFSTANWSHATALSLDARARFLRAPAPLEVRDAHLRLYAILFKEGVMDPDLHGTRYEPEGDTLKAVYRSFKEKLARGDFDRDPLAKRVAELYVEGLDALAPTMVR